MDYGKLNEILKDFRTLRRGKPVETKAADSYEGTLGYEVYHIEDDIYIKLHIYTDSYGENEFVVGVELVSPTVVQVTNFIFNFKFIIVCHLTFQFLE